MLVICNNMSVSFSCWMKMREDLLRAIAIVCTERGRAVSICRSHLAIIHYICETCWFVGKSTTQKFCDLKNWHCDSVFYMNNHVWQLFLYIIQLTMTIGWFLKRLTEKYLCLRLLLELCIYSADTRRSANVWWFGV